VSGHDVAVPAAVVSAASGRELTLVWVNDAGGLTFTFSAGTQRCFIKWAPAGCGLDLYRLLWDLSS
jgi:kanamycin kinase